MYGSGNLKSAAPTDANFGQLVGSSDNLTNFYVFVKVPGRTDWLDVARAFGDGSGDGAGSLQGSFTTAISDSGVSYIVNFGTQHTAIGESAIFKVIASDGWTGYLERISISW